MALVSQFYFTSLDCHARARESQPLLWSAAFPRLPCFVQVLQAFEQLLTALPAALNSPRSTPADVEAAQKLGGQLAGEGAVGLPPAAVQGFLKALP